jgi:NAD(P)-dependent dehydrogenase (short-subunit alcohol dehydrogenase family)
MQLQGKTAIVYGATGAIGGAVARAFARDGAHVFVTGRRLSAVAGLAKEITDEGGYARAAQVDALDEGAIERHADDVVQRMGRIDISFNAIGIPQGGIQGTSLVELPVENFNFPITTYATSHFLTARAAARHMVERAAGVILTLTATPARLAAPHTGGMGPAWAAVEALTRTLASELGPKGVRVVCIRPDAIPETDTITQVYGLHADALGMTRQQFQTLAVAATLRKQLPTLAEVASVAAFLASDGAGAMTGTVVNLSGGTITD